MVELVNEVSVTLVNVSASDDMVAMAAWVSHDADSEDRLENRVQVEKLINFLYSNNHTSPFEHGLFTFKIDAPLFVAREFFRHRTASYNEVSGRYTVMQPRFYAGDTARVQKGKPGDYYFEDGTDDQTAIYLQGKRKALKKSWNVYEDRLEAGIAKEQAREELPLSLMTQWYVTMNPLNLMKFLTLRNESHALKEIQDVAVQMEQYLFEHMPLTYAAYKKRRNTEAVDLKKLEEETNKLKNELDNYKRVVSNLQREVHGYKSMVESLQNAKADVEGKYWDLSMKYNKEFVTAKEAQRAEGGPVPPTVGEVKFNPNIDNSYVMPKSLIEKFQELESAITPVYNIVVNPPKNGEDIAKAVLDTLKKIKDKDVKR